MRDKVGFIITGVLVGAFTLLVGGKIPYFLLYTFMGMLAVPILHCWLGGLRMSGEIFVPSQELYAGDEVHIRYGVKNRLPITLPRVEIENHLAYQLTGIRGRREISSLETDDTYQSSVKIACKRRGYYEVGEIHVNIRDIFNVFSYKKKIKSSIALKVYPKVVRIPSLKIKALQPLGDLIVKDPLLQDYTQIEYLKPYEEGDAIKKIYWKGLAKSEELFVKSFEPRGDTEIVIFLDSYALGYEEDGEYMLQDKTVEVALSIIEYCLRSRIRTTLVYEEEGGWKVTKGGTIADFKIFMETFVAYRPKGRLSFRQQVEGQLHSMNQGASSIFITPSLNKELGTQAIEQKMKNRNPLYVVIEDESQPALVKNRNKEIGRLLERENIPLWIMNTGQDMMSCLEGK